MKKLNTIEFVAKAKVIHGDRYDYSKTVYVHSQTKVVIVCPIHGEFEQTPADHLRGRGCLKCGQASCGIKQKKDAETAFVKKCKEKHGDKYLYEKVGYIDSHAKIKVTCPKHGDFITTPNRILNGSGCPKCKSEKLHSLYSKSTERFISDAISVHGDMFDYGKTIYVNNKQKVKVICRKHGEFEISALSHLQGCGCPKCGSTGESKIAHCLEKHGIEYKREYYIKDTTNTNGQKRFFVDFYIPSSNTAIEYNGAQHYKSIKFLGGDARLEKQKERDVKLAKVCEDKKINLCVIPYSEYANIEKILTSIL